jgi:adenylate cyclase
MAITHGSAQEARTRWIRNTFAQFVPPEVVNEMIERPDSFEVGGQRKDLSILFSDIRSFTTIAEELGPDDTTKLLNAYLTPMTKIVFDSRGTLDKYIGDAIVAFWGAPLPVPDHPRRAAEAALAMQAAVRRMRETRPDLRGAERLHIGIGIHSAEVNVGKMGSELRFDYTATGDGMNLCSRLEGMTKQYGSAILASEDLVRRLPDGFRLRELDAIRVKGKKDGVRIFEVLGTGAAEGRDKEWLDAYAAALAAYRAGDWDAAERAFHAARAAHEAADKACDLILERIERLRAAPPSTWDGIWTFETK